MHSNAAKGRIAVDSIIDSVLIAGFHPISALSSQQPIRGREKRAGSWGEALHRFGRCHEFAAPIEALLELDLALGKTSRTDKDLPWDAEEIGDRELRARPFLEIVIEHVDAPAAELGMESFRSPIGRAVALLEIEDHGSERRDRCRPLDAGIVVA